MIESAESLCARALPALAIPTLLGLAGVSLLMRRRIPHVVSGLSFLVAISLAFSLELHRCWPTGAGWAQEIARVSGVLALIWAMCASLGAIRARSGWRSSSAQGDFASIAFVVSLLLAVVAVVIQTVVLVIRVIYLAMDLYNGYPLSEFHAYGFGVEGLWTIGFVCGAAAISLLALGDRRLGTCQLWCVVLFGTWAALTTPVYDAERAGGFERPEGTLVLLVVLAGVVAAAVGLSRWLDQVWFKCSLSGPTEEAGGHGGGSESWPGLALSVTLVSLIVLLLTCYHLLVPVAMGGAVARLGALVVTLSAAVTSTACLVMFRRTGLVPAAETAMGLATFTLCGVAALTVSGEKLSAADWYPLTFTAMIVGFAVSTLLWVQLATMGKKQREGCGAETMLAGIVPQLMRFAFLSGTLGLLASAVMAIWPRLPTVPTMDDTLGRVTAGFAANLFLLLVVLWSSRRLRRITYHMLTILIVLSCGGFIIARILPLTAKYG